MHIVQINKYFFYEILIKFCILFFSNLLRIPQAILDQKREESYKKQQQIQRGIDRVRLLIPLLADTVANGGGLRGGNNNEIPISIGNGHSNGNGHSQGIAIPVHIVQGGSQSLATSYGVPEQAPAQSYGPPKPVYGPPAPKPEYGPPPPKPVFTRQVVNVPVSVPVSVPISIPLQLVTQSQSAGANGGN